MAAKNEAAAQAAELTAEQACSECTRRVAAKLPGFDPAAIIAIITAIVQAITSCKASASEIRRQAGSPGALARLRLRRALREEGFHPLSSELNQAEAAAWSVAADATAGELTSFCGCCN